MHQGQDIIHDSFGGNTNRPAVSSPGEDNYQQGKEKESRYPRPLCHVVRAVVPDEWTTGGFVVDDDDNDNDGPLIEGYGETKSL